MGITCSACSVDCAYPVNLDTYTGCSHGCKYCFAAKTKDIHKIKPLNCWKSVENFVLGKRGNSTKFCDWNIPLRIGANSDPLQPLEKNAKVTLRCLEVLQKYQYPYIILTKGALVSEEPYITIFEKSKCVVQISACCPEYSVFEKNVPSYEERLASMKKLSDRGIRVVVRIAPFMLPYEKYIVDSIKKLADAGVYGVIAANMMSKRKLNGMTSSKSGGCMYNYDNKYLAKSFYKIKTECDKYNIEFFTCANVFKFNLAGGKKCCGTEGLDDFQPVKFNCFSVFENTGEEPTPAMKEKGSAYQMNGLRQTQAYAHWLEQMSFEDYIRLYCSEWGKEYFEDKAKVEKIIKMMEDKSGYNT